MYSSSIWFIKKNRFGNEKLGAGTVFQKFDLPPLQHKRFRLLSMSDFTQLLPLDYYQPLIPNFPAIDAISLMNRGLFDGQDGFCAVGFQATISKRKRKPVSRTELLRVRDHVRMLRNDPTLPMFLVFVTPVGGIGSIQSLGKPKEPVDDEFVQFVIRGVDFSPVDRFPQVEEVEEEEVDDDDDYED
jgi:hypothetical protein